MKNNKIHLPVVDPDTGEYMLLIKTKKTNNNVNTSKFIKCFFNFIVIWHGQTNIEIII